jgi:hypothetical protein
MEPYDFVTGNTWQKYWNTLNHNVNDTDLSNTMIIKYDEYFNVSVNIKWNNKLFC